MVDNQSQIEEKTLLAIFILLTGNSHSHRTTDFTSLGSPKFL